jgi:peptide/nickel transport system permease protein
VSPPADDRPVQAALRRGRVRAAIGALLVLLACAAAAPLVANERPLAVHGPGGWSFPALAALRAGDFAWFASLVAAFGLRASRWRRVVLLAVAAAIAAWGLAVHAPRAAPAGAVPAPGVRVVPAPVTGPSNIDLARRYAGVGAPDHPLGTDDLGRDVLARLLYGLRLSLVVGFAATAIAMAIGIGLGAWAGAGGRFADAIGSWIIQTSFCLPAVFVVASVQSLGPVSLAGVVLLLALLRFGTVARLTRQECLRIRHQSFVLAAKGLGLHPLRVFARHVLPNALIPATVAAAFGVAGAILAEAGLSFLGLGVPEPASSLGRMLGDGRRAAPLAPHLVLLPGTLMLVLVLACHAVGAALRDAVDPRGAEAAG